MIKETIYSTKHSRCSERSSTDDRNEVNTSLFLVFTEILAIKDL